VEGEDGRQKHQQEHVARYRRPLQQVGQPRQPGAQARPRRGQRQRQGRRQQPGHAQEGDRQVLGAHALPQAVQQENLDREHHRPEQRSQLAAAQIPAALPVEAQHRRAGDAEAQPQERDAGHRHAEEDEGQ